MTKSQIAAIIADREAEKSEYQGVKDKLEELLENLETQKTSLDEGVLEPIAEPYPLAGESGEDWAGANYDTAEKDRSAIASALGTYDEEVGTLMGEISEAIGQLDEKIAQLQKEIDQLWKDWESAPEEEPEEDNA